MIAADARLDRIFNYHRVRWEYDLMNLRLNQDLQRRVCIFSQRAMRQDVSRCSGFEFEDVVLELEGGKLVFPNWRGTGALNFRARRWMSKRTDMFRFMPSGADKLPLSENFDLFGCFVQKPVELLTLDAIPNWRKRSKLAVCILEEIWGTNIAEFRPLVRTLSQFDLITSAFASSCEELSLLTGRPVIHLPGAVDLKRFTPKVQSERVIDVYYLGRKRSDLHLELMRAVNMRGGFYLYDSATRPPIAADHVAHRDLLASLVQHSKLFVVDYAKIGHTDQSEGQLSWGPRHVEGIGGGAVQIGYAPDSEDYKRNFDWPEAIFRLSEEPVEAAAAVGRLLDDPQELERMRSANFAHVTKKHDWVHRWELILDFFGLPHTEKMMQRRADLVRLPEPVQSDHVSKIVSKPK